MRFQRQVSLAIILIVAVSCIRVIVCFQHNPLDYLFSDNVRHWLQGLDFPKGGYDGAADPILYQVYLFVVRRITFDNRYLIAAAAALLSVAMPWTYYRAARTFGIAKLPSLYLWAIIAWTPSLLTIYHYMMPETLLLLVEGAAVWATARYLRKSGNGPFLDMVVVWTLGCLTKSTLIPLAGICIAWACWKQLPSMRAAVTAVLVAAALLAPQAIRTKAELGFIDPFGNPWFTKIQHRSGAKNIRVYYRSHGSEIFHTHSSVGDLHASSPSAYIRPLWPLSAWSMQRAKGDSTVTLSVDSAHGSEDWKNAYARLNVGWEEWLRQWRENIILFFFAPSWPETINLDNWDSQAEFYARWLWAPLIIIVLAGNLRRFLRREIDLIPVAVTAFTLFLALQNVVTFEGRYRKPLEPLLIMNAVWLLARPTQHDGAATNPGESASL